MKIAVVGQGTLAAATETCCGAFFEIVQPSEADLVWVCYDTPIGDDDRPEVEWVVEQLRRDLKNVKGVVLISSQVPIGTTAQLEVEFPNRTFAYSPENIRVATAVEDFQHQQRVVVGRRNTLHDDLFSALLKPFTDTVIFTDTETAEMAKHALNCYLGLCIAWINEIARLSVKVGADPTVVSTTLLTERRVSPKAPLKPGSPFGGGHLARDIYVLSRLAQTEGVKAPIISHIKESNT